MSSYTDLLNAAQMGLVSSIINSRGYIDQAEEERKRKQRELEAASQPTEREASRLKSAQRLESMISQTPNEKNRRAAAAALWDDNGQTKQEPQPGFTERVKTAWQLGKGMDEYYEGYGIKRTNQGVGGEDKIASGQATIAANKAATDWGHQWGDMSKMGTADKLKEYAKAALDPAGMAVDITMSLPAMLDIAKYQAGAGVAANLAALGSGGVGLALHGAGVTAATHMEASDEANAVYEQIYNEQLEAGKDPREAHNTAKGMADETYYKNLAILGATNTVEQLTMFGGYASAAAKAARAAGETAETAGRIARLGEKVEDITSKVKDTTGITRVQDKLADMGKAGTAIEVGGRVGIGMATEGAQEGMQYIASQTSMDKPWDFGTEFAQNVAAGAAMGGGMNVAGQALNIASRAVTNRIGRTSSEIEAENPAPSFPSLSDYGPEANEQAQQAFVAGLPEEVRTQVKNDIETLIDSGIEPTAATSKALDNLMATSEEYRAMADGIAAETTTNQVRQALLTPESRNAILAALPQEAQEQLVDIAQGLETGTLDTQEKVDQAVDFMMEDPAVIETAKSFLQQRAAATVSAQQAPAAPEAPQSPGAARYTAPPEEPAAEQEVAPPAAEPPAAPETPVMGNEPIAPDMNVGTNEVPLSPTQERQGVIDNTPSLASKGVRLVEAKGAAEKRLRALADRLGLEIEFFDATSQGTAEFVMPNSPGVIYIRKGGIKKDGRSEIWALGHGFVHALKVQHPDLYDQLAQVVADTITPAQVKQYLSEFPPERQAAILSSPGLLLEEIVADEGGNFFLQADVWQNIKAADNTLFEKLVAFMREFLATLQTGPKRVENHLNNQQIKRFSEAFEKVVTQIAEQEAAANAQAEKDYAKQLMARYNELIEQEVKYLQDMNFGVVNYMPDPAGPLLRSSQNQQWYRDFYESHGRAPRKGEWREMAINNLVRGNEVVDTPQSNEFLDILSELSRGKKLSPEWKALQESIRAMEGDPELAELVADMKAEQARVEPGGANRDFERLNKVEGQFRKRMTDQPDMEQYNDVAFSDRGEYNDKKGNVRKSLYQITKDEGGFTYDVLMDALVTQGVAVSPYSQYETIIPEAEFTAEAIEQYMVDHADTLAQPDHKFGMWHNEEDGNFYLDISIVKETREEAIKLGIENNQLAVFDLGEMEEINVQTAEERAARETQAGSNVDRDRGEQEGPGEATVREGDGGQVRFSDRKPRYTAQALLKEIAKTNNLTLEMAPEAANQPKFKAANLIHRIFTGQDVHFFRVLDYKDWDRFDGVMLEGGYGTFINVDVTNPVIHTAKHEMVHQLMETHPEHHKRLKDITLRYLQQNSSKHKAALDNYVALDTYDIQDIWDEWTSDAVSEAMEQPDFWDMVRKESPDLIKKIVDILDMIIDRFREAIADNRSMLRYIDDIEGFKREVAGVTAEILSSNDIKFSDREPQTTPEFMESEAAIKFSLRKGDPPTKTRSAFKLVKVNKDGTVSPLYLSKEKFLPDGKTWYSADEQTWHYGRNGKKYVVSDTGHYKEILINGKWVKKKVFVYHPGIHASAYPDTQHLSKHDGRTWAEIEVPDTDHSVLARSVALGRKNGVTRDGQLRRSEAYLDYVVPEGFYWVNSSAEPVGDWLIASDMKIKRLLSYEEATAMTEKLSKKNAGKGSRVKVSLTKKEMRLRASMAFSDPVFSDREIAPPFYSQLQKTIREKMPNKAQPGQVLNIISKGAVKQEEIDWSGIKEWLTAKKAAVTKEEVLAYLGENDVVIEETSKGMHLLPARPEPPPELAELKDSYYNLADDVAQLLNTYSTGMGGFTSGYITTEPPEAILDELAYHIAKGQSLSEYEARKTVGYAQGEALLKKLQSSKRKWAEATEAHGKAEEDFEQETEGLRPTYRSYKLEGGEDYTELLLTMPHRGPAVPENLGEMDASEMLDYVDQQNTKNNYQSSHWKERNVLAHVRFDTREGDNGEKVLFVQEVQSDWHQEGRKFGYGDMLEKAGLELVNVMRDSARMFRRISDGTYIGDPDIASMRNLGAEVRKANKAEEEVIERWKRVGRKNIPDAPFKKSWQELVLKRMIRYAAENGYDRVAWTTGEQQAERYNLTKFIDSISYREITKKSAAGEPLYDVVVRDRNGTVVAEKVGVPVQAIEELAGKEIAQKVANDEGKYSEYTSRSGYKLLAGLDLEIGGEGMKGFYDKMLPAFLNKYVKKWGAKVEKTSIVTGATAYKLVGPDGRSVDTFYARDGAERYLKKWNNDPDYLLSIVEEAPRSEQPSIPITEAMKESVLQEGQPLFSDRKNPPVGKGWLQRGNITTVLEGAFAEAHKAFIQLGTQPGGPGTYKQQSIKSWEEEARNKVLADREKAILDATDPEMKVKDAPVRLAMALQLVQIFSAEAQAAEAAGDFVGAKKLWAKATDINFKAAAIFTRIGQGAAAGLLWSTQDGPSLVRNAYHRANRAYEDIPQKVRDQFEQVTQDGQQEMDRINGEEIDGVLGFEGIGNAIQGAVKATEKSRQEKEQKRQKVSKAPPEILAAMVRRYVSDPVVQNTEEDPVKTMLKTLMEVVKEKIPKEQVPKAAPVSPIEILRTAMMNREQYRDVWAQAQAIFKDRYGLEFDNIEEFLGHYLATPYAQNQAEMAAAKAMKDLDIDILDAVAGGTLDQVKADVIAHLDNVPYLGPQRGGRLNQSMADAIERVAERARDKAGKKLAKQVEKMASDTEMAKPTPASDMMTTLLKIVKKTMAEKGKPEPRNPMEVIAEAIKNRDAYKDIWLRAHAELFEKHENDPAFETLDQFFRSNTYMGYTTEQLNAGVSYGLKALEINIKQLIREHYTKVDAAGMTLATKLMENLDIDPERAVSLESAIRAQLNERTQEAKTKALDNLVKKQVRKKDRKSFAQKMIELSNLGAFGVETYRNALAKDLGLPVIDEEAGAEVMRLANLVQTTDGAIRAEALAQLNAFMASLNPPSTLRRISTFQTMMMLLNTKTNIRNITGNEGMYWADRYAKYLATPIDIARSKISGTERTVTFRTGSGGRNSFWAGFAKGWRYGWRGWIVNDVTSQYDLQYGLSFPKREDPAKNFVDETRKQMYNIFLSGGERLLRATLQGFDYAAYNRAYNTTMGELACLACINNKEPLTKENIQRRAETLDIVAEQMAQDYGKYLTFQDDNMITRALVGAKRAMNLGLDWGPGDWILKFPRTAGGLMMRGLEYSPLGVIRCVKYGYLAFGPEPTMQNQRELSLALSRMMIGSFGLTAVGIKMAALGLIFGAGEDDKDFETFARSQGMRTTGFNATGLRRWLFSGFDAEAAQPQKGDLFITYDWAQPLSASIAMGVSMSSAAEVSKADIAQGVVLGMAGAINSVVEQPLLRGIQNLMAPSYGNNQTEHILRALGSVVTGIPASFMPSTLNLTRQYVDNVKRYTRGYGGFDVTEEALNMVKNKVPWLSKTLPASINGFGQEELLQSTKPKGALKFFHAFLNPAYVNRYNPTPEAKLALDIYRATGSSKHLPNPVPTKITVNGAQIPLSARDRMELQKELGRLVGLGYMALPTEWTPDQKAAEMTSFMSEAWTAVRDVYLIRNRPQELVDSMLKSEIQKAKEAR